MNTVRQVIGFWVCCLLVWTGAAAEDISLLTSESGETLVQFGDAPPLSLADLEKSGPVVRGGLTISIKNGKFDFLNNGEPLTLNIAGVQGLNVRLPKGQSLSVAYSQQTGKLDLAVPGGEDPIHMQLNDGSIAVIGGGSSVRLELFKDDSYLLQGQGDVTATSPDDFTLKLGPESPPFTSGKLQRTGSGEQARLQRLTPLKSIVLKGTPPELSFDLDGKEYKATRHSQIVTLENGTRFSMKLTGDNSGLDIEVTKGVLQFGFPGIGNAQPFLVSGNKVSMSPDYSSRTVEIKNLGDGPNSPSFSPNVLVATSPQSHAALSPGATFQYSELGDAGGFSAAASGRVVMHDANGGEPVLIPENSVSQMLQAAPPAGPASSMMVFWENDQGVLLKSGSSGSTIRAGSREVMETDTGAVEALFQPGTGFHFRAVKGNVALRLSSMPDLSFQIPQGAAVVMDHDPATGRFVVQAGINSGGGRIIAQTSSGYIREITSASVMTVVTRRSSPGIASLGGNYNLIFFEAAGAGPNPFAATQSNPLGFNPAISANLRNNNFNPGNSSVRTELPTQSSSLFVDPSIRLGANPLDVSRINQPAVTVLE